MSLPRGTGTVLVADDDAEVRDLTGRILKMAGYTPLEAADAPSTIERLRTHPEIALVLLDLRMPGSPSCGETVGKLRRIRPGIPILVMTGFPERDTREDLGEAVINDLLEKPFRPPELIHRIRRALGQDDGDAADGG